MMRKVGIVLLVGTISLLGILSISVMAYQEAPELRVLVAAGELPPVEERLPKEPLVRKGFDGLIGKYGGVLRVADISVTNPFINRLIETVTTSSGGRSERYFALVKSIEEREGGREWIIHMREGMKWSNGVPVTADDIMFYVEDFALNEELNPDGPMSFIGIVEDEFFTFEKIDEYTVRVHGAAPFDIYTQSRQMLTYVLTFPRHYLEQFHPKYADKDELDKMVKEAGLETWMQLFGQKCNYAPGMLTNPDYPTLLPWVLVKPAPSIPVIYKRNPYYIGVDEEGKQLPYIGEIHQVFTGNEDIRDLKILAGEVDFAQAVSPAMYPLFKDAEKEGKIKVLRWAPVAVNTAQVEFNLTDEDPVLREIFQDKRFRFACSYALDRQMISDLLYFGQVKPAQVAPREGTPFYHERLAHTALEYDTVKANKLLDEMGLDKRDADGWRLRSDGKRLMITIITTEGFVENAEKIGEIVTDNLRAVGLDVNLRVLEENLFYAGIWGNAHDCFLNRQSWATHEGEFINSAHWQIKANTLWAPLWREWVGSKGERGEEPPANLLEACELSKKAQATTDLEEQKVYMKRVLDIAADNLWTIGTVSRFGTVMIVNYNLKNVPTSFKIWDRGDYGLVGLWFYEE